MSALAPAERLTFAQICANQTVVGSNLMTGCLATAQGNQGRVTVRLWAREEGRDVWSLRKSMNVPGSWVYVRRLAEVWVRTFDVLRKEAAVEQAIALVDEDPELGS